MTTKATKQTAVEASVDWEKVKLNYQAIKLEGLKVHDAFAIKGKVSGYWNVKKSNITDLKLTWYPQLSVVELTAPGVKTLLVNMANIPFMTPGLEDADAYEVENA